MKLKSRSESPSATTTIVDKINLSKVTKIDHIIMSDNIYHRKYKFFCSLN